MKQTKEQALLGVQYVDEALGLAKQLVSNMYWTIKITDGNEAHQLLDVYCDEEGQTIANLAKEILDNLGVFTEITEDPTVDEDGSTYYTLYTKW